MIPEALSYTWTYEENGERTTITTDAPHILQTEPTEVTKLSEPMSMELEFDANALAANKRGRKARRVKDVKKFVINFTVNKNITAETGERTLYINITKPDNTILVKDAANTFTYENRELPYSIKKYIEYTGEAQEVTVYWEVEEYLYAGDYRVDIFAGGNLIGSQGFTLK